MCETRLLVAAIDFGSSGTGYGFSFGYQYAQDPINVHTSIWNDTSSFVSCKVPTVLLFDAKRKFESFGFEAEEKYENLCNSDHQDKWYYFKGFKMQLYNAVENNEDIREDFQIMDIVGKQMSAKMVFTTAIRFIKDHLISELKIRNLGVVEDMIYWVLSVPAIWNESCKQFMRKSAENAGIKGDKLYIVLEPEAASVYARLLPVDRFVGTNKSIVLKTFDPGKLFIVLDAGGGTVDISTQEVDRNGELKVIHKVCGGPWGGECVNREFMKLMKEVFGIEAFKELKQYHGRDLLELTRNFERKKKLFKKSSGDNIQLMIPYTLIETVEKVKHVSIAEVIASSKYKEQIRFKRDKLTINGTLFESMFTDTVSKINNEIRKILTHARCRNVSAIMMVGGFSESDVLQKAVKGEFSSIDVYIPLDGSLAVLKGAVIYGHNPNVVSSRVCNYTYGVQIHSDFNILMHDISKMAIVDGQAVCVDVFHSLYTIDEEVKVGECRSIDVHKTYLTYEMQIMRCNPTRVLFFASDKAKPMYTTDDGCRHLATIIIDPPGGIWPEITIGRIELEISGTEMTGTFVFNDTGERTAGRFEFLPTKSINPDRKRVFDPFHIDL